MFHDQHLLRFWFDGTLLELRPRYYRSDGVYLHPAAAKPSASTILGAMISTYFSQLTPCALIMYICEHQHLLLP